MEIVETFLWGLLGGIGAEVAVVFSIRDKLPTEYPYWLRSWVYWAVAAVMVLLGGGIAVAYSRSGTPLSPILALQIGASAPLIFRKLRETVPETPTPPDPGRVD